MSGANILFGYTGRDWDVDAELQYNRARWYDPAVGRWLSQDPIGFEAGDANLYRYVGNGSTNAVDPSGLAEGHHWVPLDVAWRLRGEGLLTEDELWHFSGRFSGRLKDGHDYWREYNGINHEEYSASVEEELRSWKASRQRANFSAKEVANNIRDGRHWHGRSVNETLSRYNHGVFDDMTATDPSKYDGGTPGEIKKRGQVSLRNRGKYAIAVGATSGLLSLADAKAQGEEIARILKDGRGITNARVAALRGDLSAVERCIIGEGFPEESTFEELRRKNRIFAEAFRVAAREAFNKRRADLDRLEDHVSQGMSMK